MNENELSIIRKLAERKREIANDPVNAERREAWIKHDSGTDGRIMVLAEAQGIRDKNRPVTEDMLECKDPFLASLEADLKFEIWRFEVLKDDHVVEPYWPHRWRVESSNYGVEPTQHEADDYDGMGSRSWDAPITDLDKDFDKLKQRTHTVDREATMKAQASLEEVFQGILPVEIRGKYMWTLGMTMPAIDLIGLENLMMFMFDNPDGLKRLMAFLRDDHIAFHEWLEAEGLLTLNNRNDYIGSGSEGHSNRLPQSDWKEGDPVRMKDQWVLLESQETVGVGPDQFGEFVFPYQNEIAKRFGMVYYGCCEPLHGRWDIVSQIENLERVSISPWCDQEIMAEKCGSRYVFSRKPSPTMISTGNMDEDAVRANLSETLSIAKDCRLELLMKDIHTLNNELERLPRWVQLARGEIDKAK